jgi:hypothetical protein
MKIYRLKWQHHVLLLVLIAVGYFYARWQHDALSSVPIKGALLFAVAMMLFLVFFSVVKPARPMDLGRFLAIYDGVLVASIILTQHVIIVHDLSARNGVVWLVAIVVPLIGAGLYGMVRKKS